MEKKSGDGGAKPATRFGFSWADEVEREEREQQHHHLEAQRPETKREQTKADPFGAARPREVVLAEEGVDWRARDRELHAPAPHRSRYGAAAAVRAHTAKAASASACRATPARRAPRDRPHPRRHAADSTPQVTGRGNAPPASHSAWGGGKRKCAGEGPARRVPPVDGQGRRVLGELNVGEGCGSSAWISTKKSCNAAGAEVIKASEAAVADCGSRGGREPATTVNASAREGESTVGQERRGREGDQRRWRTSKLCYSRY